MLSFRFPAETRSFEAPCLALYNIYYSIYILFIFAYYIYIFIYIYIIQVYLYLVYSFMFLNIFIYIYIYINEDMLFVLPFTRSRRRDDLIVLDEVLLAGFMRLIQRIGASLKIARFLHKHELLEHIQDLGCLAHKCSLTQTSHFVQVGSFDAFFLSLKLLHFPIVSYNDLAKSFLG